MSQVKKSPYRRTTDQPNQQTDMRVHREVNVPKKGCSPEEYDGKGDKVGEQGQHQHEGEDEHVLHLEAVLPYFSSIPTSTISYSHSRLPQLIILEKKTYIYKEDKYT